MIEIVLIDANITEARLLEFILRDLKQDHLFSIRQFRLGKEALQYLRQGGNREAHIVLSELRLPDQTGYEILESAQDIPGKIKRVLAVHSLQTWQSTITESYQAGAQVFLSKEPELRDAIEQMRGFLRFAVRTLEIQALEAKANVEP